jgi:hypothetical protein
MHHIRRVPPLSIPEPPFGWVRPRDRPANDDEEPPDRWWRALLRWLFRR